MNTLTRTALVGCSVLCVALAGCKKSAAPPTPAPAPAPTTTTTGTPDAGHEDDHETIEGEKRDLGVVEIAGRDFEIALTGNVEPHAEVEVSLAQLTGTDPARIRVWIGIETGVGSMKVRTHSHDIDHHAIVEVPAEVTDATALWIEIEERDGTTVAASVTL